MIDRVRRVRASPTPPTRVRRVRAAPEAQRAIVDTGKPRFVIDWNRPLSWKFSIYMVTSYTYYILNKSVILDSDFDRLCKELFTSHQRFRHQHKHLVDKGQFAATTGYAIKYPQMVIGAAHHLLDHYCEV